MICPRLVGGDRTLGLTPHKTTRWQNLALLPPFPSAHHEVWKENHRKLSRLFFVRSFVHSHSKILQHDLYSEWRPFYIDYNLLKRELKVTIPLLIYPFVHLTPFKSRTTSHNWDATDEQEFTNMLEGELDKIHDFQKAKVCVIVTR